jgi:hypothetical protein
MHEVIAVGAMHTVLPACASSFYTNSGQHFSIIPRGRHCEKECLILVSRQTVSEVGILMNRGRSMIALE